MQPCAPSERGHRCRHGRTRELELRPKHENILDTRAAREVSFNARASDSRAISDAHGRDHPGYFFMPMKEELNGFSVLSRQNLRERNLPRRRFSVLAFLRETYYRKQALLTRRL